MGMSSCKREAEEEEALLAAEELFLREVEEELRQDRDRCDSLRSGCKREAEEEVTSTGRLVPSKTMRKNMRVAGVSEVTWEQRAKDIARVWGIHEDQAKKICGGVVEGSLEELWTQPKHDIFGVRG